jgi:uncharacterized protein YbjT (DUF2867 family)
VDAARVRKLVRPSPAGGGDLAGGEIPADLTDPAALRAAVAGAGVLHVVVPNLHPDEVRVVQNAVAAAQAGGVPRIVYHSVLRPGIRQMPHHWGKLAAEAVLWGSGLEVTVLQPSAYAQNLLACVEKSEIVVPYSVDVPFSLVDLADVADVTARVLAEPGVHGGACYELAGPVTSVRELATRLELGARRRPVIDGEAEAADYSTLALRGMFDWYDRHGLAGSPRVLEWLLGRPPREPEDVLAQEIDRVLGVLPPPPAVPAGE